jgi:drug/metabolite transporter (DMT)-like permease
VFGRKPSLRFWFFAVLGTLLVIAFSLLRGGNGLHIQWADGLLILAVLSAALGYVFGAKLSQRWKGEHVICWVSVFLLPITVPLTLYTWPTHAVSTAAWGGFVYVTLLSAWLGMFVWYRALAMGDAVKVSQLQLAQPFLSIVFSIPLLGEQPDQTVWIFGIAVILTVFLSRK